MTEKLLSTKDSRCITWKISINSNTDLFFRSELSGMCGEELHPNR